MAGGVDKVELVFLAVLGRIVHRHGARLNGDAALALQLHIIQNLRFHGALVHSLRLFQNAVCQGGFSVVDMGNDTKIADMFCVQLGFSFR